MMRRSLCAFVLIVVMAAPALAQTASSHDTLRRHVERAQSADWYVRVTTADTVVLGRIVDIARDTVRFAGDEVGLADIERLERRHKEGGGALIGALGGGIALGGFLFLMASGFCDTECDEVPLAALAGVTLGGTVGGLLGALLVPGVDFWEEIWERV